MSLITLTDPSSPVSEAYRTLRTNLMSFGVDEALRTLVVSSAETNDDKSKTAANLAVTMAQGGNRTLLVDADMRRPALHDLFGISNGKGLSELILEGGSASVSSTNVENLSVLTAGSKPLNPADLLGSKRSGEIIDSFKEEYDIVVFDAPPVIPVTDAVVLGSKVDGVLLVVQAGKSRRDHAEKAKAILDQAKVRILGATLTNAPKDDSVESYY